MCMCMCVCVYLCVFVYFDPCLHVIFLVLCNVVFGNLCMCLFFMLWIMGVKGFHKIYGLYANTGVGLAQVKSSCRS